MADDQSTTEDTSVSEDTSTNEEAQDTEADLDDFELTDEAIESGDETEESKESEGEAPASAESDETEEESEEDEGENPDEKSREEDTASEEDRERAAKVAYEQREARRRAEKANAQQEFVQEAEDDKDLALRQLQVDAYNNRVEGNLNRLENGIQKAVGTIDLFKTGTPVVKEELADSLDDFERMYVIRDRNGDPIDIKVDPVTGQKADVYQYLQRKADSIRRIRGDGATQQSRDKTRTTARTVKTPSRTPKQPKVDPDLAAFDEEAARW